MLKTPAVSENAGDFTFVEALARQYFGHDAFKPK